MPHFLLNHFWLLCGLWTGGIGALSFYSRLKKHVISGIISKSDLIRFVRGWLIFIASPCIILWLIQLSIGADVHPQYLLWPEPQKWFALSINIACWVVLLWWVWIAGGAQYISRIALLSATSIQKPFPSVMAIKITSLLLVASSFWAIGFWALQKPGK